MAPKITREELISRALDSRLADVWTSTVGTVVKLDPATGLVDVQPGVPRAVPSADGGTVFEKLPIIPSVRPLFIRTAGGVRITFQPIAGTRGLLVFLHTPADGWLATGEVEDPVDTRTHHPTSAIFVPGVYPDTDPTPIPGDAGTLEIEAPTIVLGTGATDYVAMANKVLNELQNIEIALSTHKHGGVTTGGGTTAVSDSTYSASDVGSTTVKVKD